MNKKLVLSGIILVLFTLLVNSAFAAITDVSFTGVPVSVNGNPGEAKTISFTANNAGAAPKSLTFTSSALSFASPLTPTILDVTVPAASGGVSGTATISFTVTIPSTLTQAYTGTITATETISGQTDSTASYTINVGSIAKLDVDSYDNTSALEIIGKEGESGVIEIFTVRNSGSQVLSGLTIDTSALDLSDSDNDTITLSFSDIGTLTPGQSKTITATANFGSDIDLDTYGGLLSIKSGATVLDSFKVDLRVFPEICEDGITSDGDPSSRTTALLDLDIREPDNGDDFKVGDKLNIDVKVKNDGDEDLDVVVEAILYDLDENEEIATAESESQEIKDGNSKTFEFELEVPKDSSLDVDNRYVVYIKVAEDGNEDQNCNFDYVTLDFKREKNDVIADMIQLLPSRVKPGQSVELRVDIKNEGTKDQEGVYVKVINTELDISEVSNVFDLDKAGDADDEITKRFTLAIPNSVAEKDYSVEVTIFDEDDDAYDNGQEFVTLTVKKEGAVITPTSDKVNLKVITSVKEIDASKGAANLHFMFTNNEAKDMTGTVEITSVGNWAQPVDAQTVSLHPGDNNLYFDLKLKEDVTEGMHTAMVTVKPAGYEQQSYSFNFDVKGSAAGASLGNIFSGEGSTLFWIIGDVVLVIIALFFLKAMFFGRKSQ